MNDQDYNKLVQTFGERVDDVARSIADEYGKSGKLAADVPPAPEPVQTPESLAATPHASEITEGNVTDHVRAAFGDAADHVIELLRGGQQADEQKADLGPPPIYPVGTSATSATYPTTGSNG